MTHWDKPLEAHPKTNPLVIYIWTLVGQALIKICSPTLRSFRILLYGTYNLSTST